MRVSCTCNCHVVLLSADIGVIHHFAQTLLAGEQLGTYKIECTKNVAELGIQRRREGGIHILAFLFMRLL